MGNPGRSFQYFEISAHKTLFRSSAHRQWRMMLTTTTTAITTMMQTKTDKACIGSIWFSSNEQKNTFYKHYLLLLFWGVKKSFLLLFQKRIRYCSVWDVVQNWVNIMKNVSKPFPQKFSLMHDLALVTTPVSPILLFDSRFPISSKTNGGMGSIALSTKV